MPFKKATKARIKLRMAIEGPAGSGKTYTALTVAKYLADGQPVALIDTERGSASKYADLFTFDVLELETFHPQKYVDAINEAVQSGYAVVVIDSLSHAWDGKGGILEIVRRKGNSFNAWGDVAPVEDALLDALTGANIHIISTMRTKTAYEVEKNEKTGKMEPRKVGLAAVQRQGLEYEFDVVGRLDDENTWTTTKTRCPALTGALIAKPGKPLAETLRAWLAGAPPTPKPPTPTAVVGDDTDDETIPYSLDDPNLAEDLRNAAQHPPANTAEKPYNALSDTPLRKRLNVLGIRTVAEVETFVVEAQEYCVGALRDACYAYLERQEEMARRKATRGRAPHALAAVAAPGEEAHDLAELGVGSGRN